MDSDAPKHVLMRWLLIILLSRGSVRFQTPMVSRPCSRVDAPFAGVGVTRAGVRPPPPLPPFCKGGTACGETSRVVGRLPCLEVEGSTESDHSRTAVRPPPPLTPPLHGEQLAGNLACGWATTLLRRGETERTNAASQRRKGRQCAVFFDPQILISLRRGGLMALKTRQFLIIASVD